MKLSNIALLSAAAATASAYDHKSAAIVELEVYMTDIVNNMDQYLAMQEANPGQAFPSEIMSAYIQIAIGNTISYTSFFSTIDESEVEFMMTGVSWYSARLAPSVSAALLEAGIDTNDENVATTSSAVTPAASSTVASSTIVSSSAVASSSASSSSAVASSTVSGDMTVSQVTVTETSTDSATVQETVTLCSSSPSSAEASSVAGHYAEASSVAGSSARASSVAGFSSEASSAASSTSSSSAASSTSSSTSSSSAASSTSSSSAASSTSSSSAAAASANEAGATVVTLTDLSTTLATITSCDDHACTEIVKNQTITSTIHRTVKETVVVPCETTSTTNPGETTASPVTLYSTITDGATTTLITITSCEDNKCSEVVSTKAVNANADNKASATTLAQVSSISSEGSGAHSSSPIVLENTNGAFKYGVSFGSIIVALVALL
ncbi:hypothetical protein TPHA_0I02150 [Tetrapisispora phaffii CBS 4417]|uniref:Uncharacterized protein n=1 Tax=Tetrapisispora phaffii (strain ATCC 24235 / CBS 4417 / NBRC 1672 / NRRL Y-8282 / UCD 70-5) TaxID=1071381 RepID=G8BXU1_TETPH|nr:hypothetical protein TPHA_0I02150 [Tetrapisispora phaffii CBS 4417]CCE64719.1 hypothetical protein TPHA_0I02150 [Tetrapisispora phaffii CBS 4417]